MPTQFFSKMTLAILLAVISQSAFAGNLTDPTVEPSIDLAQSDNRAYWEGAYVGATIGYNFGNRDRIGITSPIEPDFRLGNFFNEGWAGSLRAGYRWQTGRWVFGPEIAIEGGKIEDSVRFEDYRGNTKLNHAFSLRLKGGRAVPVFNSIVYGTIGVTRGSFDYDLIGTGPYGTIDFDDGFSANGYILGFGIEHPLTKRLSVTGEYEYVNYGKTELTDSLGNVTVATPLFHNVKVGLNLRF
ncbi:outer membrane protein [Aliiroseovarius sp. 2305UL8-7]|uniref:outer membrane protein n=1 Tax=Aliiroseovarius conchicola TaxID=3121637 RepID=UPI003529AAED